jgi:hypothetical protein
MTFGRIILTIDPGRRRPNVRFETFLAELTAINAALVEADRTLSPSGRQTTYYDVVDLRRTSPPEIELEARPLDRKIDHRAVVLNQFFGGLRQIGEQGKAPDTFDRPILEKIQAMAASARKRGVVTRIKAGDAEISLNRRFEVRIDRILSSEEVVFNSVEGRLEAANFHMNTNYCAIYPAAGARKIAGRFSGAIGHKVLAAMTHHVRAFGRVFYRYRERHPYWIEISDLNSLESEGGYPRLHELQGIAPNLTNGKSAEDYVREIRDEWT